MVVEKGLSGRKKIFVQEEGEEQRRKRGKYLGEGKIVTGGRQKIEIAR